MTVRTVDVRCDIRYVPTIVNLQERPSKLCIVHALKFVYSLDSLTMAALQKLLPCADTIGNIEIRGCADH